MASRWKAVLTSRWKAVLTSRRKAVLTSRWKAVPVSLAAILAVVGLGVTLLPAAAYAGVSSHITATAVSVSATCSGTPGANFTITGPDGKTFTVNTPNSDTAGFEIAGRAKGTY